MVTKGETVGTSMQPNWVLIAAEGAVVLVLHYCCIDYIVGTLLKMGCCYN